MGDGSKIEWTDATWNPTVGCTKVSEGCEHCYAERLVEGRMRHRYPSGFGLVRVHSDRVNMPLRWTKPRRVFVNSLSDVFHEQIPVEWKAEIFAVMAAARRHTFQVLTKRPGAMSSLLNQPGFQDAVRDRAVGKVRGCQPWDWQWPLPNVWLGTSVETQKWADVRIPKLLETPAAVRFLSAEPLLGPVDLGQHLYPTACPSGCGCRWPEEADWAECGCDGPCCTEEWNPDPGIHWVIVGGESGPGARPMHPQWVRDLRDQCDQAAGVAFFFKQWGEHAYLDQMPPGTTRNLDAAVNLTQPIREPVRVGKKAAGRLLDGRTWDQYPTTSTERSAS
jgi:protein gp37